MFEGFSQRTGDFLWALSLNNDRVWFREHRQEFDETLDIPMKALTADVLSTMRAAHPQEQFKSHISRIYRDARRLFGRGPFKDHLWFSIHSGAVQTPGAGFWFEVGATGWSYGMGLWDDAADMAQGFRDAVDEDPAAFGALVNGLSALGDYQLWGQPYKRPKGSYGPVIDPWYNRKNVGVGWEFPFGGLLFSPELPRVLSDTFEVLMPMYRFLCGAAQKVCARRELMRQLAEGTGDGAR